MNLLFDINQRGEIEITLETNGVSMTKILDADDWKQISVWKELYIEKEEKQ